MNRLKEPGCCLWDEGYRAAALLAESTAPSDTGTPPAKAAPSLNASAAWSNAADAGKVASVRRPVIFVVGGLRAVV